MRCEFCGSELVRVYYSDDGDNTADECQSDIGDHDYSLVYDDDYILWYKNMYASDTDDNGYSVNISYYTGDTTVFMSDAQKVLRNTTSMFKFHDEASFIEKVKLWMLLA